MGLLSNPLRPREPKLPTYNRVPSPTKERLSDDFDRYSSDYDSEAYASDESPSSSRTASGSMSSGHLMLPKGKPTRRRPAARLYPYRLPAKVTRYIALGIMGTVVLMILSLVRASQVENWKVANGKVQSRPPPPPVWQNFPFLERYYGGLRTLLPFKDSRPEYPGHNEPVAFDSTAGQSKKEAQSDDVTERDPSASKPWETYANRNLEEDAQECFIDAAHKVRIPSVHYHNGRPEGFPQNAVGSYEVLNLPEDICFDRFGRFGPYGFGYSVRTGGLGTGEYGENNGSAAVWETTPRVDFRNIDWADVQRQCFQKNAARFNALPPKTFVPHGFYIHDDKIPSLATRSVTDHIESNVTNVAEQEERPSEKAPSPQDGEKDVAPAKKARTAVVVRCWDEYFFREDDIANIRSMITELALASGGRYDVHLLVQVKNDAQYPIWADHDAYQKRINDVIPEEFRGLVTLWTETQMLSLYQGIYDLYSRGPELPVHGVYRGLSMAMQYFAYMHPEYDFFWQWEMDVRYTGHYYDFFTKVEQWAKAQPRKGLWERNERFYFPDVHGTWEDFSQMARVQSEMGTVGSDNVWNGVGKGTQAPEKVTKNDKAVWGPERAPDDDDWFEPGKDDVPPRAYEKDHYEWGVDEEADYISLNPIFDPEGTTWLLKDDITGFNRSQALPPRRANIITTSRLSRRLLMSMHKMTAHKKQFAFPEMWPATVALQHGYKAVYAPHPVYVDRKWPIEFMTQTYNGGKNGASGGSRTSIYGEREHNLQGLTWFYNSGFAPNLYRRWMGLKVNNDGGDEFENTKDESKVGGSVGSMPGGEGRMCLPPMLLHPVKDVEIPVEVPPEEGESVPGQMSDPTA